MPKYSCTVGVELQYLNDYNGFVQAGKSSATESFIVKQCDYDELFGVYIVRSSTLWMCMFGEIH